MPYHLRQVNRNQGKQSEQLHVLLFFGGSLPSIHATLRALDISEDSEAPSPCTSPLMITRKRQADCRCPSRPFDPQYHLLLRTLTAFNLLLGFALFFWLYRYHPNKRRPEDKSLVS
ncbi:hypothetical protein Salat_2978600 [Sesamum alatum]|uniref:Uncharacterized protein n=1 Tax=Sesamum alatum TaxID=300844 RepID=A0AAE1XHJ2_9LAMI|nr:hypothetical protein Salat_2978600 [Sesamum alatum]